MSFPRESTYSNFMEGDASFLFDNYGLSGTDVFSTEMGTVTETLPKEMNEEWEWFKFSSLIKPHFVPDGHGAYEVVVEVRRLLTYPYPAIFGNGFDFCTPSPRRLTGSASTTLR